MQQVRFRDLGLIDYKACWDYQEELFAQTVAVKLGNRNLPPDEAVPTQSHLLFCEHPHVYTLGKSGHESNLLVDEAGLNAIHATYYKINRGGDITYHGPGQLVGYPVLDLDCFFTDIHRYLRLLEEVIIRVMAEYGLKGERYPGYTGVWLDAADEQKARKICAMGVRASRWVTMHGWAFNVNTNLDYFSKIVPCGIDDKAVTSMKQELGHDVNMEEVKRLTAYYFELEFGCKLVVAADVRV
ncbi:MAG: lipoyl(octanoyl) transferase LipB [Bacteroidetes bacterium]|nr:lipoyl(octanoyl) transferase LipB [Bacteroidota bacterium]